jgi:hypothetical protein
MINMLLPGDDGIYALHMVVIHTYPVRLKRLLSSVQRSMVRHPPWNPNMAEELSTIGRHGCTGFPTSYTTLSCSVPPNRIRNGANSVRVFSKSGFVRSMLSMESVPQLQVP